MGIRLSNKLSDSGNGRLIHQCPGCNILHMINTEAKTESGATWTWNRDPIMPTFNPSIIISHGKCHYFIREGQIIFCSDSKHELAGQIVPLPDLPSWLLNYEGN